MIKPAIAKPNIASEEGSGTSIAGSANAKHGVNNKIAVNPSKYLFINIFLWVVFRNISIHYFKSIKRTNAVFSNEFSMMKIHINLNKVAL